MNLNSLRRSGRVLAAWTLGLSASVTAGAYRPPPVHVEAHKLTQQSLRHLQSGNRTAALHDLRSAQQLMWSKPSVFSAQEKQKIQGLISQLTPPRNLAPAKAVDPIESYRHFLKTLDPLRHLKHTTHPPPASSQTRDWLHAAWKGIPRPVMVRADVRQFAKAFRAGAASPIDALLRQKYLHLASTATSTETTTPLHTPISTANAELVDAWLQTPEDRRIFVIGARGDATEVETLRAQPGASDMRIFFYQDCQPLCLEATIGGFFATAGKVVYLQSQDAKNSRFVTVEKGISEEAWGTGRRIFVIDGDAAVRLLKDAGAVAGATALLPCDLTALTSSDTSCK